MLAGWGCGGRSFAGLAWPLFPALLVSCLGGSRVMGDYLGLQVMLGARDAVANIARLLRYMYYIICSLDVRCIQRLNPPTRATLPSSSFYLRCQSSPAARSPPRLPPPATSLGRVQTSAGLVLLVLLPCLCDSSSHPLTSPLPARLRPRGCLLTQLLPLWPHPRLSVCAPPP
jgi:hypothetical protein